MAKLRHGAANFRSGEIAGTVHIRAKFSPPAAGAIQNSVMLMAKFFFACGGPTNMAWSCVYGYWSCAAAALMIRAVMYCDSGEIGLGIYESGETFGRAAGDYQAAKIWGALKSQLPN